MVVQIEQEHLLSLKGVIHLKELPYVIIISFIMFISWIDYRKKVKKAESEEEIRKAFVPFLLVIVLFVISISVFLT